MKHRSNRSGQALVMATLSISLMLGLLSFAVDLGWGYFRREAAQSAADSAAAAAVRAVQLSVTGTVTCGSGKVWCGSPAGITTSCPATAPTSATTSFQNACMLASSNGFTTTGSKTVSVQANTTTPFNGVGVSYWVTVRISETPASFFSPATFSNKLTSNVVASAAITLPASSSCIIVLGSTGTTLNMSNGATVTTSSCGVSVASSSSSAASVTGGAVLTTPTLDIVGSDSVNNGGKVQNSSGQTVTPTAVTSVSDPFSSVPAPTITGSCVAGNYSTWQASAYTPGPGCYSSFTVSNGVTVNMQSGLYIINGGQFNLNGGTLTANNVTIYLTNGASLNIGNGITVTMTPQSSGIYEGILFFQDRSDSAAETFQEGANINLTGSLYFPDAAVTITDGSSTAMTQVLIGQSVTFGGGATLNLQKATSQSQTGMPVALVSMLQ